MAYPGIYSISSIKLHCANSGDKMPVRFSASRRTIWRRFYAAYLVFFGVADVLWWHD